MKSPRMQAVWQVLEAAKDAGDATLIQACRRLIVANRSGRWIDADWQLVRAFA